LLLSPLLNPLPPGEEALTLASTLHICKIPLCPRKNLMITWHSALSLHCSFLKKGDEVMSSTATLDEKSTSSLLDEFESQLEGLPDADVAKFLEQLQQRIDSQPRRRLERKFDEQLDRLVERKFPHYAGMSDAHFRSLCKPLRMHLHKAPYQKHQKHPGRFRFLLVIPSTIVPLWVQVMLLNQETMTESLDINLFGLLARPGVTVPSCPYLARGLSVGNGTKGRQPAKVAEEIRDEEQFELVPEELVAIALEAPDIFNGQTAIAATGMVMSPHDRVPHLDRTNGTFVLGSGGLFQMAGNRRQVGSCEARLSY